MPWACTHKDKTSRLAYSSEQDNGAVKYLHRSKCNASSALSRADGILALRLSGAPSPTYRCCVVVDSIRIVASVRTQVYAAKYANGQYDNKKSLRQLAMAKGDAVLTRV